MEIGHYTGILAAQVAESVLKEELRAVSLKYMKDGEWQVWVQYKAGDTYILSDEGGWNTISFKNLREALVFLKGLGVSKVHLELAEWSVNREL